MCFVYDPVTTFVGNKTNKKHTLKNNLLNNNYFLKCSLYTWLIYISDKV